VNDVNAPRRHESVDHLDPTSSYYTVTNGILRTYARGLFGLNGVASYGLLIQLGRRTTPQPVTAAPAVAAAGEPGSAPAVH